MKVIDQRIEGIKKVGKKKRLLVSFLLAESKYIKRFSESKKKRINKKRITPTSEGVFVLREKKSAE